MRIYHAKIQNFRGIKEADFNFTKSVICLIGAGDSTKSTILDAIEYALSPNWFIPFDDSDFTDCDVSNEIIIEATVGSVPDELISDTKFGLHLRGWKESEQTIHDEPDDEDIRVLTIRLKVDQYLIPEWSVVTDRTPDGIRISYRDRQRFGVTRIGTNIENELSWTRGSSLLRLTADKQNAEQILLEANRQLRCPAGLDAIDDINTSIESTKEGAKSLGLDLPSLRVDIDPKSLRASVAVLSLHHGSIPVRRLGLGSRRLVAIGAQLRSINDGSIVLIDEIEHTLEPHRIKHLIRQLVEYSKNAKGQIIMTSHSPATLEELGAGPLYIVSNDSDTLKTAISEVRDTAQGTVRTIPEAFLSPRNIVCEGATEIGILRSFEKNILLPDAKSFALAKVIFVSGGGTEAPQRAKDLKEHGYDVCLFADSDRVSQWKYGDTELISLGIRVVRWADEACTEMRLVYDLPNKEGLRGLVETAIKATSKDNESILKSINDKLEENKLNCLDDIDTYLDEKALRRAIFEASVVSGNEWFKTITRGEIVGDFVFTSQYEKMKGTDFFKKINDLKEWVVAG